MKSKILLSFILILAFSLRFYKLGEIPAGIHRDEESHGYNAFSLMQSGKDRYGQPFPLLFRSFGSYQPPLYTYFATIPISIFGNRVESARSVSALAGTLLVLITYFLSLELFSVKKRQELALISSLIIAISPWSIYFSRLVAEGNLGVLFFVSSLLFFTLSLRKIWFFVVATTLLALSTHAYYSERIISLLFLPSFIFLFRQYFLKHKKGLILGLFAFIILMMPHLFLLTTGALTRRLVEVGYLGTTHSFLGEFIKRYLIYFSPRNLFFDLGSALGRMPPTLGVFYTIFIIPFIFGIKSLRESLNKKFFKLVLILIIITPVSAALTGDSYYPLRALESIWIFALIISLGFFKIIKYFPGKIGFAVLILIVIQSLVSFYFSYFILFKYERAKDYGNVYLSLFQKLNKYKDYKIIIDSARDPGAGLRLAYLTSFDPKNLQKELRSQLESPYYSKDVKVYEIYTVNNIKFKPIDWKIADCKSKIMLVGDNVAISDIQARIHNLKYEFEVKDISGYDRLTAYKVNASKICNEPK